MIPSWLTEKLANPPSAGAGIHGWLFSVARQLHAHLPPEAIAAALTAATARCERRVATREIRDAVNNSVAVAWQPKDAQPCPSARTLPKSAGQGAAPAERWPKCCPVTRRCRIADAVAAGVAGMADLWEASPVRPDYSADDWLDVLFPGAEWLCLAVDHPATARTRRRDKWTFGAADECGLVVPSPMTAPSGKGLDGRQSHRCLDNTGPRRWLVVEFDSGALDEQAALHWHLRSEAAANGWPRLVLCVHSGGKSLHGWYGPISSEETAKDLMSYAVSLGADPATWNRCQLVRLPGGRRAKVVEPDEWSDGAAFVRLEVFFFDLTPCNLKQSYSAPGAPLDSTQPLEAMAA